MRVRLLMMCVLLWAGVAVAGGPGAVRKQVESSMLVTGTLDIEPDGSVSRHALDHEEKLPAGIVAMIGRAVPGWRFKPVVVDGKPTKARSKMSLRIVARKLDDEQFIVKIGNASFGEDPPGESPTSSKMAPPGYPMIAAQNGVHGTVYLVLRIGRDGRVEDAVAEQVNLKVVASEAGMTRWRGLLAQAALRAAKGWTFNPPEKGGEVDAPFWSVRVPIDFQFYGAHEPKYGEWEAYIPGPRQLAPWIEARDYASSLGPDALAAGGVYRIDGGQRLLTPLDGS